MVYSRGSEQRLTSVLDKRRRIYKLTRAVEIQSGVCNPHYSQSSTPGSRSPVGTDGGEPHVRYN